MPLGLLEFGALGVFGFGVRSTLNYHNLLVCRFLLYTLI